MIGAAYNAFTMMYMRFLKVGYTDFEHFQDVAFNETWLLASSRYGMDFGEKIRLLSLILFFKQARAIRLVATYTVGNGQNSSILGMP